MTSFSQQDHQFMARAIELAKRGRYTTSPNPNVGCVIVKNGEIVGEGWHQRAGQGHAEVNALAVAGEQAQGATCYVTLEPCSHYGRTPPCAEGLIKAGVAKVVAAMVDPNPQVSGRGLAMLKQAGIETDSGLLENDAKAINQGFITRMLHNRPYVRVKMAASLDGMTAMQSGESKWITSAAARRDVQNYRAQSCAVLSGADTVIDDNASLNVREAELPESALKAIGDQVIRQPIRVVTDSRHRLTPELNLFTSEDEVVVVGTNALDKATKQSLGANVENLVVRPNNDHIDLSELLSSLAQRNINELWVETGATLAGALLEQKLVDEIILYQAPKLMGSDGRGTFTMPAIQTLAQAINVNIVDVRMVGPDVKLTLKPDYQ